MPDSPTIGDLRRSGELLECGCWQCGRHGYFDPRSMPLPDALPVCEADWRIHCSTAVRARHLIDHQLGDPHQGSA